MKELYQSLMEKIKEVALISEILNVLYWDLQVMIPPKGYEQRGAQTSYLEGVIHQKFTDPTIGEILAKIQNHSNFNELTDLEKRNIQLIQRDYDKETKIPKDLVEEMSKHGNKADQMWKKAKEASDFALFEPYIEKWVELLQKRANYINPSKPPFEVLLDEYERGFTSTIYTEIFNELKENLIPLIKQILNSPNQPNTSLIKRQCSIPIQEKLANDLLPIIGYDLEAGRLDVAVHPFTNGILDDVRITTEYEEEDFSVNFFCVLHEGGHGIYEQNKPREYHRQPIGEESSAGMHESQSRFFENMIGRSTEFWEFYLHKFKKITAPAFDDVELIPFVKALNQIQNSLIRVEADEVTYSLHCLLRFEIERDLFAGKIKVKDLPQIWNAKIKEYFGLDVPNDAQGVLQDTHWAWGLFGYFPTYTLGNLYGAQFLNKLTKDIPDWKDRLRQGDVLTLKEWLAENIHRKGAIYDPLDLIQEVTGEKLNSKYFVEYLKEKYSKLYELEHSSQT